jgi:hypothetical protein
MAVHFVALHSMGASPTSKAMSVLRPLSGILLALIVMVSSLGMAMARGAMAAEGQLCSVTGPAPVVLAHDGLPLFDAKGDPVELARTPCPDCVIGALALVPAPAPMARPAGTGIGLAPLAPLVDTPLSLRLGGEARGPPLAA